MKPFRVFEFRPAFISFTRTLFEEGECECPYDRRCFLIQRIDKCGKVYFSLECSEWRPRDYVRRVTRVTPLADYEAKVLLVSCFFYESEYALSVGSSWGLRTQPKTALQALEYLFPDWKFIYDDYLSDTQSQVDMKEDRRQRLILDRVAFDRCVKRSVFPRLAIAPKIIL